MSVKLQLKRRAKRAGCTRNYCVIQGWITHSAGKASLNEIRNTIAPHTITTTKRPAGLQIGKYIELETGGKRKEGQSPHSHSGREKSWGQITQA